jgi:hypothetical protein
MSTPGRRHGTGLRPPRWFPDTSTPHPPRCAPGRFRGVGATHVPAAGPASQPRRAAALRATFACTCNVLRRRFMGRTLLEDGPWAGFLRKESRWEASPSCFRPRPLVPGLFSFQARVILRTDGPTRPTPRLPVRGTVPPFPHPEPPLLFVLFGVAPSPLRRSDWRFWCAGRSW